MPYKKAFFNEYFNLDYFMKIDDHYYLDKIKKIYQI